MAETGPCSTVPVALDGRSVITPKEVPGPVRILTVVVVRTVLPMGNAPGAVVAVRVGVRVGVLDGEMTVVTVPVAVDVLVDVGVRVNDGVGLTVGVRVGVAVPITATNSDATQPFPSGVETGMKT